ncbi:MAG: UDP-N-acetylmuramoyl-tripeptide--D-alanyl-D-alanine ligase [Polyangiales bacterium]
MATPIPHNQASFNRDAVLAATRGRPIGRPWDTVRGVVTDSREVQPGNLFVALRGERFDARVFATQAAEAGAAAVIVERGSGLPDYVSGIEVDDPLLALGDLARAHRMTWNGRVIGITGSVGKTSTKELTAAALRSAGLRVLATTGNLNNRIGVPMTLFQLDATVETAVVEMGTSAPGEIARLAEIAVPDVGIVTRASLAHTEGLGSVEAVADEKVSLLRALAPDGLAVAYGDDPPVRKRASVVRAKRKLFYGREPGSDVRVVDWDVDVDGTRARFQVRGKEIEIAMALLGEGAVLNAAGALAIAFGLDLSLEDAAHGIATVAPSPGRMQLRVGDAKRLIVDDSYNANPASMEVALNTARAIADDRRVPLILVLGDMKELGAHSQQAHRQIGELVADAGALLFVGCGPGMREAVKTANARGTDTLWFEDATKCGDLVHRLPLHAVILVKGSRSMEMERVIAPMLGGGQR